MNRHPSTIASPRTALPSVDNNYYVPSGLGSQNLDALTFETSHGSGAAMIPRFLLIPCLGYDLGGPGWNHDNVLHDDFNVARARARSHCYESEFVDRVEIVDLIARKVAWVTSVEKRQGRNLTFSERGEVPQS